ncbi:MAG: M24 family metallopeptidase, partial [Selenomonadaceae bacterium]|nr:M24 family metallopeptidase [Selenomonadaceae bacterium]
GGKTSERAEKLVRVTKECMELGIEAAKPWHFLGDIGAACAAHAKANGYSVVTDLGGHGVGKKFHLEPFVSHDTKPDTGMLLVPGMVLTVEPMINEGKKEVEVDSGDHWTVRTRDRKLSAQWEKTILITETGREVLSS